MPPAAFSPLDRVHLLLHTLCPAKQLRPILRVASGQDWTLYLNTPQFFRFVSRSVFVFEKVNF